MGFDRSRRAGNRSRPRPARVMVTAATPISALEPRNYSCQAQISRQLLGPLVQTLTALGAALQLFFQRRFRPHQLAWVAALAVALASPAVAAQDRPTGSTSQFRPEARRHISPVRPWQSWEANPSPELGAEMPLALPPLKIAPTRSSFLAHWPAVPGATGYLIDISTSPRFDTYVPGYDQLDVGKVTSRIITHLRPGTRYYYRIVPYGLGAAAASSEVMTEATTTGGGLVIDPTFDSSITSNANAAAIESTINAAIALYQSLFADPITVEILYRYATTRPDGTPIQDSVAVSDFVVYSIPWSTYLSSLEADAKTTSDASANANLPTLPVTNDLVPSGAGGRAIGFDTPPAMFANGSVGDGGPYDGIVTLNSADAIQFTRPPAAGNYDARRFTEHEIDEVLGLGSYLGGGSGSDFRPQDLFSWSAPGTRSHSAVGTRYFSIDNGNTDIVGFNQDSNGDFGDWLSEPCPQTHPYVQNAFGCAGQLSDISATSPEGINLDVVGYDLSAAIPPPGASVLGNVSTRVLVQTGDEVLIGGFIISGTQPKQVIVRGIGPSISLPGVLADPMLELHDSSGAIIATNDNWRTDQEQEILASGLAPTNDNESAILMTLDPGAYTAIVSGANGGTGIALVEVYDLDQTVDSKLGNISTRGIVQTQDNVLIGGFIVLGQDPISVLVRALGPSLPLDGSLADPTLELHDANGALLFSNDNWKSDQEAAITATGIAPTNDLESAILMTLAPSSYTAIVRGAGNATGIALFEAYALE